MSLIDYSTVRPWARSIKNRTALRDKRGVMPPWFIERNIGIQQFKDDPSLSEDEIAKSARGVDNGAPAADRPDTLPPRVFLDAHAWESGDVQDVAATIVPRGERIDVARLANLVDEKLEPHARPRYLRIVDEIDLTDGYRPLKRPLVGAMATDARRIYERKDDGYVLLVAGAAAEVRAK